MFSSGRGGGLKQDNELPALSLQNETHSSTSYEKHPQQLILFTY